MAKFHRANGATSVLLRVNIQDTASVTGAGKTGLTEASAGMIIGTIADVEATTTRYRASSSEVETIATLGTYAAPTSGKCRFREVDAVNHPGLYELQLADARFAVANAKLLIVTISGAAGAAQVHAEVQQDPVPADVVRWLGVAALPIDQIGATPAEVRAAIGMSSANLDTQLAAIQADTDNIQTRLPAALVSGRMSSQVGAIGAGVITAASTSADFEDEIAATVWSESLGFYVPTTGSAGWALSFVKNKTDQLTFTTALKVDATCTSTGDELDAEGIRAAIGMAEANLDVQLAAIGADTSNIPANPVDATDLAPIKAKTDQLTFTVPGAVDGNVTHVIADAVRQDGSNDTHWGGQT